MVFKHHINGLIVLWHFAGDEATHQQRNKRNGRDLNTDTRECLFPDNGKAKQVDFEIAPHNRYKQSFLFICKSKLSKLKKLSLTQDR